MSSWVLAILAVMATIAQAQDNVDQNIQDIFGPNTNTNTNTNTNNNDGIPVGYEEVTTKTPGGIGAITRCGEGEDKGRRLCVPYYQCDGTTKTIIPEDTYDGTGQIDIRFGSNDCGENYLDVCCKIPKDGIPPVISSTTPSEITSPPVPQPSYCGIRNNNGIDFHITGNENNEAEYGELPWMVAILHKQQKPDSSEALAICGGSLISPTVVLTGAHCVYKYKTQDIKIRAGEWDTQTTKERWPYQERDVAQIIVHENFAQNNLFNNVALLVLDRSLDRAEHIATICLPPSGMQFNSRECFASGWGKDVFGKKGTYQVILKKIELPIVNHQKCEAALQSTRLGLKFKLHNSFTCAGGEAGKDTCTGDGGSPLVCPDPNNPARYLQAGIVAWGIGCGENGIPGVYADVSKFRSWVDQKFAEMNLNADPYTL